MVVLKKVSPVDIIITDRISVASALLASSIVCLSLGLGGLAVMGKVVLVDLTGGLFGAGDKIRT